MMDSLHCNSCFYQSGDSEKRGIYLTECGHIYCKSCLKFDNNLPQTCKFCRKQYELTPINTELPADLKETFSDPCDLLIKALKVLKFQNEHRLRFFEHNKQRNLNDGKYKEVWDKAKTEINCLKKEVLRLQEENKQLKQKLNSMHYNVKNNQTPHSSKRKTPFNFSPMSSQSLNQTLSSPSGVTSFQIPQTPLSQTIGADRICYMLPSQRKTNTSETPKIRRLNF